MYSGTVFLTRRVDHM